MSDIQFDLGEEDYGKSVTQVTKTPAMVALLIKHGVAKDVKTANYILLGGVILAFIIAGIILF